MIRQIQTMKISSELIRLVVILHGLTLGFAQYSYRFDQAVWSHLLPASFRSPCRFTGSQAIRSQLSCPDSSLSLSRCATLLRRHMGRATRKGLTWSVARHYNHTVSESHLKHSALPGRRQEPQCMDWGFCRLGVEIG